MDNYLNFFENWIIICFKLENEWVKLSVFDVLGSELKVLINQCLSVGEYEV